MIFILNRNSTLAVDEQPFSEDFYAFAFPFGRVRRGNSFHRLAALVFRIFPHIENQTISLEKICRKCFPRG